MSKPGEKRLQILQALAAMLEDPKGEKITTAAIAGHLKWPEAAHYRHFAGKAQRYEELIEFIELIESSLFGLINQLHEKLEAAIKQALRVAATQKQISNEADFNTLANILLYHVAGRRRQPTKSSFSREPTANWAQQWPMLYVTGLSQRKA